MRVCELSASAIEKVLHSNQEKHGAFGSVFPYNKFQLIKLYRVMFSAEVSWQEKVMIYKNKDKQYQMEGKKLKYLCQRCEQLEKSESGSYIDAVVTYQDYPIGIIMKWYQGYEELQKIYPTLSPASKKMVELKIWKRILELEQVGIYPYDLKGKNTLIHPGSLDTVLIDLDDGATKCASLPYKWHKETEKDVLTHYQGMIKELRMVK